MHCVWLCSHRLLRGGGRVGAHTLYAYWGFVHTLAVSWDIPPSGIVIGVTSILEVCLMRSQPCADLLYEATEKTPPFFESDTMPLKTDILNQLDTLIAQGARLEASFHMDKW